MRETVKNTLLIVPTLVLLSILGYSIYYNPIPTFLLNHYNSNSQQNNLINTILPLAIILLLLSVVSYLLAYRTIKNNWLLISILLLAAILTIPLFNDLNGYSFLINNISNNVNNNILVAISFAVISITIFLFVYKKYKNTWLLISILLSGTALLVPILNNFASSYFLINNIGNNSINNSITAGISFAIVGTTIFLLVYKQLKNTWLLICFLLFLGILVIPVLQNTDPFFIIENYIKNNRVNNDALVFAVCLAFIGLSSFLIAYKLSTRTWVPIFILLLLAMLIVPIMNEKDQFFSLYHLYATSKAENSTSEKAIEYANNEKKLVVSNMPADSKDNIDLNNTTNISNIPKSDTAHLPNTNIKKDSISRKPVDTTPIKQDTKTDNFIVPDNNTNLTNTILDAPPAEKFSDIKSISPDDKLVCKVVSIKDRNALMVFPSSEQWKEMFVVFPVNSSQKKMLRSQVLREFEGVTYPSYQGGKFETNGKQVDITLVRFKGPVPKEVKPYYLFLNSGFSFLIFGDYSNPNQWYYFENGKVTPFKRMSDMKLDK